MKLFLGIDPGAEGAAVVVDQDGRYVASLPFVDRDVTAIRDWLEPFRGNVLVCALEKVGVMPGDGGVSAFEFGRGFGMLEGLLSANRIPTILVRPQAWQASSGIVKPQAITAADLPADTRSEEKRADSAKGKYRRQLKRAIMEHARRRWPDLPFRVQAEWGVCDAIMLADHARRHHLGETMPKEVRASRVAAS